MQRERIASRLRPYAGFSIGALAIATALSLLQGVRAADEPIDLDKNAANGSESMVSTKVLQTYPVRIENTVINNAAGTGFNFVWAGAGPGGFNSFVTPGPGVGTKWVWSTVYQVYTVSSPVAFAPSRALPTMGSPSGGVQTTGSSPGGSYTVQGKSIYPTQITVSDASLTASLITFFSPEKTVATCGVQCEPGQCELFLENETGGSITFEAEQLGCCPDPHNLLCGGECKAYLTDTQNCGGCGNVCAADEICSNGACVCPPGQAQCGSGCIDPSTDPGNCGTCGNTCAQDENCTGGACICDPGLTQCGAGCVDLLTTETDCGTCGNACDQTEFCAGGSCDCNPGLTDCGGACLDLQTDPLNCGVCGTVCPTGGSCSAGACVCPAGQTVCGGACIDLQNDPLNCGSCGNMCEANDICTSGRCVACRPPTGTACGNRCVNTHTDPENCGGCGFVCDFSGCPSSGQGTCSQGSSCVCSPGLTSSSTATTSQGRSAQAASTSLQTAPRAKAVAKGLSVLSEIAPARQFPAGVAASPLTVTASAAGTEFVSSDPVNQVVSGASSLNVQEAPVCDLDPIQQVIPAGGTYTQVQAGGRFGKEIQTSVSIVVDGKVVAQGPCPQIVPVTGVDTSGVILSPIAVATMDSSGDGLCQPGEARCDYFISVAGLGDTPCTTPVATLSSPPDAFNLNEISILNATASYGTLPGYPGDGVPLERQTNQTPFSIVLPSSQASDVGRPFLLNVACSNLPAPVEVPLTLGIGGVCNPLTRSLTDFDQLNGLQGPVNARLVSTGLPINYSNRSFNKGSTIPLKLSLACGAQGLSDAMIEPNPRIFALDHETLGSISLAGINGDNNANPDDPGFSCADASCDYQFRTDTLPVGRIIISIQMPDTRVFRAGITITP